MTKQNRNRDWTRLLEEKQGIRHRAKYHDTSRTGCELCLSERPNLFAHGRQICWGCFDTLSE